MAFICSQGRNSLNIKLVASDTLLCHMKEHSQVPGFGSCVPLGGGGGLIPCQTREDHTGDFSSQHYQIPDRSNLREKSFVSAHSQRKSAPCGRGDGMTWVTLHGGGSWWFTCSHVGKSEIRDHEPKVRASYTPSPETHL